MVQFEGSMIPAEEPAPTQVKYELVMEIMTNEQDQAEFKNHTMLYGGDGRTFRRLLMLERVFKGMSTQDYKELVKMASVYGNVGEAIHVLLETFNSHNGMFGGINSE